jgi:hypothetical protein
LSGPCKKGRILALGGCHGRPGLGVDTHPLCDVQYASQTHS